MRDHRPYPAPAPSTDDALAAVARLAEVDPVAHQRVLRDIATVAPDIVHAAACRLLASHYGHPSAQEES